MINDPDLALTWDSRLDEIDHRFEELRENHAMLLRDLSKIYGVPLETITSEDKGKEEMGIIPVIDVHQNNGVLVTTSRNIAEVFSKEHYNVLKDIKALVEASPDKDFTDVNFYVSDYTDSTGRKLPEYLLTRDGAMLLVMGYNGSRALELKTAYIKRFNEMEKQLKEQQEPTLTVMTLDQKVSLTKIILECAGITGNQLALALDKGVRTDTGSSLLSWSGTQLEAPIQEQLATPTQLGRLIGISARKVNSLLAELGYQTKTANGWEPTKAGLDAGGTLLDVNKAHSNGTPIRQLKWPFSLVDELKQALEEE